MVESWRPIPGYPHHEISSCGRVRSFARGERVLRCNVRKRAKTGLPVKVTVSLSRGVQLSVHRLMLDAFIGPCPEGMMGCHNDGNPLNNHLSNLRWDTQKSNIDDAKAHGTWRSPPVTHGENHHNATISDADVSYIRSFAYYRGLDASLARRFGVAGITIRRIRTGESRP